MRAFMERELFGPLGMRTASPVFDAAGTFVGSAHCPCSARDFARFGLLFLRDGVWDGRRILPEGWADYVRTPSPVSGGIYGAHFWTIPGSLGTFECHGAFGQRITICPKLDLVVVRVGQTAPHKVGAVVAFNKAIEAAIAREGGFDGLAAEAVAELAYWRVTGGDPPGEIKPVRDADGLTEAALAGFKALVARFDDPTTPYLSMPDPDRVPRFSDYAHLARVREWTASEGGDEP